MRKRRFVPWRPGKSFWKYLALRRTFVNLVTKGAPEYLQLGLKPDCKGLRTNTNCRSQQNAGHILPGSLMKKIRAGESGLKDFLISFLSEKVESIIAKPRE